MVYISVIIYKIYCWQKPEPEAEGDRRYRVTICSKKWFAKNNYGQTGRAYFMDLSLLYSIVRPFSGRNTQHIDVCVLFFYFMDISNYFRCTTSTYGWVLELRLFLLRNLKSLKRTPQNSKISHWNQNRIMVDIKTELG